MQECFHKSRFNFIFKSSSVANFCIAKLKKIKKDFLVDDSENVDKSCFQIEEIMIQYMEQELWHHSLRGILFSKLDYTSIIF